MKARVYFTASTEIAVTVDVPDETLDDERSERAIEMAYEELPGSLCVHCSGWGRSWSRDEGERQALEDTDDAVEWLGGDES